MKCPTCKAPNAYVGVLSVECENSSCRHYKPGPEVKKEPVTDEYVRIVVPTTYYHTTGVTQITYSGSYPVSGTSQPAPPSTPTRVVAANLQPGQKLTYHKTGYVYEVVGNVDQTNQLVPLESTVTGYIWTVSFQFIESHMELVP